MKKFLSSLFAVLFLTGISFAQPPEPPVEQEGMEQPHMSMDGDMQKPPQMPKQNMKKAKKGFEEIAKEINLTDEQKQQIETMAKADKDKKKEIRKQMKEKFKAIDAELLKENYDINVINGLTADIQALQSEMAKTNIDSKVQMRSILTYDQFKQIEEIKEKNKEKFMNKAMEKKEEITVSTGTAKTTVEKNVKEDLKSAKKNEKKEKKEAKKNSKASKSKKK